MFYSSIHRIAYIQHSTTEHLWSVLSSKGRNLFYVLSPFSVPVNFVLFFPLYGWATNIDAQSQEGGGKTSRSSICTGSSQTLLLSTLQTIARCPVMASQKLHPPAQCFVTIWQKMQTFRQHLWNARSWSSPIFLHLCKQCLFSQRPNLLELVCPK